MRALILLTTLLISACTLDTSDPSIDATNEVHVKRSTLWGACNVDVTSPDPLIGCADGLRCWDKVDQSALAPTAAKYPRPSYYEWDVSTGVCILDWTR